MLKVVTRHINACQTRTAGHIPLSAGQDQPQRYSQKLKKNPPGEPGGNIERLELLEQHHLLGLGELLGVEAVEVDAARRGGAAG